MLSRVRDGGSGGQGGGTACPQYLQARDLGLPLTP